MICCDWPVRVEQGAFMREYGQAYARVLRRPGMAAAFDATFAEINELVRPAAIWGYFPVAEMRHEKVLLAGGARIGNGPVTTVMGGAERLVLAVCTIGQPVVDRIHSHKAAGETVEAMLLDQLGSLAVGQLSQLLFRRLEMDAALAELRISTYLSPGESAWTVKDQAVIFDLLDPGQIGVTLTETLLMKPIKSVSLMAGVGSQPMGQPGATHCDYCTIADRCPFHGQHGVTQT